MDTNLLNIVRGLSVIHVVVVVSAKVEQSPVTVTFFQGKASVPSSSETRFSPERKRATPNFRFHDPLWNLEELFGSGCS